MNRRYPSTGSNGVLLGWLPPLPVPHPLGSPKGCSHPALHIPAPRELLRDSQTQAPAPRSERRALPSLRNLLTGESSREPGQSVTPTAAAHPPTSPQGATRSASRSQQPPGPQPRPGGGSGSTPPAPWQAATPGAGRGTAAGMLIHPAHVQTRFVRALSGPGSCCPARGTWMRLILGKSSQILPQEPRRAGQWAEHRQRAAGGLGGDPRREGDPPLFYLDRLPGPRSKGTPMNCGQLPS